MQDATSFSTPLQALRPELSRDAMKIGMGIKLKTLSSVCGASVCGAYESCTYRNRTIGDAYDLVRVP
jgi:hypothetical protein